MTFTTREAEGSLFANDLKETEQQPDYTGRFRLNGALYRLAGWKREAQSGRIWLALKITSDEGPARGSDTPAEAAPAPKAAKADFDDDIPF